VVSQNICKIAKVEGDRPRAWHEVYLCELRSVRTAKMEEVEGWTK